MTNSETPEPPAEEPSPVPAPPEATSPTPPTPTPDEWLADAVAPAALQPIQVDSPPIEPSSYGPTRMLAPLLDISHVTEAAPVNPPPAPPRVPAPAAPANPPVVKLTPNTTIGQRGHIPPSPTKAPVVKPPPPPSKVELQLQLPNGSVDKPYDVRKTLTLLTPSPSIEVLSIQRIEGLADLGLKGTVSGREIHVTGTPTKPGDHTITIFCTLRVSGSEVSSHKQITLTVNPDPRSLWKDLEPAPGQPFFKPHLCSERLAKGMVLIGASRRGRSHAHEGKFREDDFRLGALDDRGWHYMVVADGAGSANFSRRGSELACETVCQAIGPHLAGTLGPMFDPVVSEFAREQGDALSRQIRTALYKALGGVAHEAYRALDSLAKSINCPIKDLATTLNLTICKRYDEGWFVAAFAVGDGGVAVYRPGASFPLNLADSGEFAGQTRFLTMPEIMGNGTEISNRIHFALFSSLTAIIGMTDGISDPKFATDKNFTDPAKWDQLWADIGARVRLDRDNPDAHTELLDWLDFWSTGNHDDRTIALMLP